MIQNKGPWCSAAAYVTAGYCSTQGIDNCLDVAPSLLEGPGQHLLMFFMSKIKSLVIFVVYILFRHILVIFYCRLVRVERNSNSKNWNIIFEAFLFGSTFSTINWWDTRESKKKD